MAEYIERELITEYLMDRIKNYREMGDRIAIIPLNFAMAHIKSLPAADVEPVRHGHWEWDWLDIYCCSACGEKSRVKEVMGKPVWDYCPNCGAKMDGGASK